MARKLAEPHLFASSGQVRRIGMDSPPMGAPATLSGATASAARSVWTRLDGWPTRGCVTQGRVTGDR
jgi:hypothetical protein